MSNTIKLPRILTSSVIYNTAATHSRRVIVYYFATLGHIALPGAVFFNAPTSIVASLRERCCKDGINSYPEAFIHRDIPIPTQRVRFPFPAWSFAFLSEDDPLYSDTRKSVAYLNDRYTSTYNGSYIQSLFKWYPGSTYYISKVRKKNCSILTVYNDQDQLQAIVLPLDRS